MKQKVYLKTWSATHDFVFNQTMFRIKDPERTLKFYSDVLHDISKTPRLSGNEVHAIFYSVYVAGGTR